MKRLSSKKYNLISLEIELIDLIIDVKERIEYKLGVFIENQELKLGAQVLENDSTVQSYSIIKDSTLLLNIQSPISSFYIVKHLLKAHRYNIPNEDTKNFVKYCECVRSNPNLYKRFQYEDPYFITNFYPQYTRKYKDFVYQTCKAYIDTIYKIYGSRKAEEFDEIYKVADYKNIINSYSPKKAIDLIESSFHHGILSYVTDNLTIRDAMTMSVIVQFSTSKSGYEMIKSGYLIEKPEGKESEFFVVYIKSYSLSGDYMICSFANGYEFGLRASATHKCEFTILYYTSKSIDGKTSGKKLEPKYKEAYMCYDCKEVDCFWMDEETASYSQDYVFAYRPNVNSEMPYFGIEINQYILHIQNFRWRKTLYIAS